MNRDFIASRCICCDSDQLKKSPAILMPFVAKRVFGWEPVEITPDWGLRDIRPGMAYPLCNSVQCSICGALFLDMRFDDSGMSSLYSGYRDQEYVEVRERFEPGYKARNTIMLGGANYIPTVEQFLSRHLPLPARVLDWGGDTGVNTPFRSRCKEHHIFDISGRPVVDGAVRVDKATVDSTNYDLVVFSNVLEHVPFPADTLLEITSAMSVNTVLYLEVPNEDLIRLNPESPNLLESKKHWHEHINFFTRESLRFLLGRCALEVIEVDTLDVFSGGKAGNVFLIACRKAERPLRPTTGN